MKRPNKVLGLLLLVVMTAMFIAPGVLLAAPDLPAVPSPPIFVQDYAGLLDEQTKNKITGLGQEIERQSGAQLVVVTVNGLDGYPISEYANDLFRKWGLGDKKKNNGVLLLVNKENLLAGKSGKVRIEVGYGLEGAIPDGKAGRILDNYVLPRWQNREYSNGIWQGYLALAGEVAKEYNLKLAEGYAPQPAAQRPAGSAGNFVYGFIVMLVLFAFFSAFARKSSRRNHHDDWGGGFGGFGGWGGGGFGGGGGGGFGGGSSGGGGADR